MKRVLATFAVLALLVLPVLAVAGDETPIPPEAKWSPVPPTPQHLVQKRLVSKEDEQANASQPQAVTPVQDSRQALPEPNTTTTAGD
jgi:hypothetical protein